MINENDGFGTNGPRYLTKTQIFRAFSRQAQIVEDIESFLLPPNVDENLFVTLWNEIRPLVSASYAPGMSHDNVKVLMTGVINRILTRRTDIKYLSNVSLTNPVRRPNGAIVRENIQNPAWRDVIIPFQYKKPNASNMNEGCGQAISNAWYAWRIRPANVFAIATDLVRIRFMILGITENRFYMTEVQSLFEDIETATPSEGFKNLVRVLLKIPIPGTSIKAKTEKQSLESSETTIKTEKGESIAKKEASKESAKTNEATGTTTNKGKASKKEKATDKPSKKAESKTEKPPKEKLTKAKL